MHPESRHLQSLQAIAHPVTKPEICSWGPKDPSPLVTRNLKRSQNWFGDRGGVHP